MEIPLNYLIYMLNSMLNPSIDYSELRPYKSPG